MSDSTPGTASVGSPVSSEASSPDVPARIDSRGTPPANDPGVAANEPHPHPNETPTEKALRKLKGVVDGKEVEFDVDDERILRALQKESASDKRIKEAAQAKKERDALKSQIGEFVAALREDPVGVLIKSGIDPSRLRGGAEKFLVEQLAAEEKEFGGLPPEAVELKRQLLENQKKLQTYEEQQKKAEEERQAALDAEQTAKAKAHLEERIVGALQQGGVPPTPLTVKRIAQYMAVVMDRTGKPCDPSEVIPVIQEDYLSEHDSLYEKMDDETLLKRYAKLADRIRKADLARLDAPKAPTTPKLQAKVEAPKDSPRSRGWMTREERDAEIERRSRE